MNNKAQTSLEFIVIMGLILLFSFYFSSAIYATSQVNKGICLMKQRSLDLLSLNNSRSYVQSVNYNVIDYNINFDVSVIDVDGYNFNIDDFSVTSDNIINSSSYENVNIDFKYM